MDIMELLVRLLSNTILIGLLFSCSVSNAPELKIQNEETVSTFQKGGIRYVNDSIYTGVLYTEYPQTGDTISYKVFVNGLKEGKWFTNYANGVRAEERYFENGNKEGVFVGWWPNGIKKFEYHFFNDEYEGTCSEWNPEGKLVKEMNYVGGHEFGAQKVWYDNGKIKSNYVVKNGRRYGLLGTKNCVNTSDSLFLD